ncbi:hypothetical protein Y032_0043g728 [Ancylostoma ceylanicum]|uniref:Uncharacterized protein n=1 Tax=Ancylostoma ceylanicum TaxID=53326 RepID=A0A016UDR6_9BILA|nr:hypothetical protein Y032_0043g728 [Ancylostoma ceylanicum]
MKNTNESIVGTYLIRLSTVINDHSSADRPSERRQQDAARDGGRCVDHVAALKGVEEKASFMDCGRKPQCRTAANCVLPSESRHLEFTAGVLSASLKPSDLSNLHS